MREQNPIDFGIRMADRTLAAFGIVPPKPPVEPAPSDTCKQCGFVYSAHGLLTTACPGGKHLFTKYSPEAQIERAQLQQDIDKSERILERFRTADEPAKRKEVGRKLVALGFAASLALEFGCPDDRLDTVIRQLNLFTQAFDALHEVTVDIRLAEMEIEDAQRTLADAALWEKDGGAA